MLNDKILDPKTFSVYTCNESNWFQKIEVVSEQMLIESWCSYFTPELENWHLTLPVPISGEGKKLT